MTRGGRARASGTETTYGVCINRKKKRSHEDEKAKMTPKKEARQAGEYSKVNPNTSTQDINHE
jgi:hypothetical protein